MYKARIRCDHVRRDVYTFDIGPARKCQLSYYDAPYIYSPLVLPVGIHCMRTAIHLFEVFQAIFSANDMLGDEIEQAIVPCASAHKLLAV
jgi:hypothetical protein